MSSSHSRPATRSTSGALPSTSRNLRSGVSSASTSRIGSTSSSSSALKRDRDTFSAELERDTNLPNTKRHLRTNLSNTLSAASLERKVATLETTRGSLEGKLREKDSQIELLERDRRWLAEREKEEREERERTVAESKERETNLFNELSTLRTAHSTLQNLHSDLQESQSTLQRTSAHQIELLKSQLSALEKHNAFLQGQVEEERIRADRASELSESLPTPSIPSSAGSENDADHRLLTVELHHQADYLRELESKNTRLQADLIVLREQNTVLSEKNSEVEVIREEKRGLEKKLKIKEELAENLIREGEKIKSEKEELLQQHASPLRRSVSRMSIGSGVGGIFTPKRPQASYIANGHSSSHLPLNKSTLSTHLGLNDHNVEQDDELMSVDEPPSIATTSELVTLRLKHATLLETNGKVAADLAEMTARCSALKAELEELKKKEEGREGEANKKATEKDGEIMDLRIRLRVKNQELEAVQREVGFLNQLVDKLSSDTMSSSPSQPETQNVRISQLETLLAEAKRSNEDLRREVDTLLGRLKEERSLAEQRTKEIERIEKEREMVIEENMKKAMKEAEVLHALGRKEYELEKKKRDAVEKELQEAQSAIATHLTTIDNLEQQLFDLGGEIAGGRHIPPGVRVLCTKENPVQEEVDLRQSALDRLRAENEALLKRLGEVEARLAPKPNENAGPRPKPDESADTRPKPDEKASPHPELVPRESFELVSKEREQFKTEVDKREKRMMRLREIYEAKSKEFRDVVTYILGAKLKFLPNGQVRVSPVYDRNTSFVFEPVSKFSPDEGMKMRLVETTEGAIQDIPNLMQYWVEKEQSVPGFMASVTLETYETARQRLVPDADA